MTVYLPYTKPLGRSALRLAMTRENTPAAAVLQLPLGSMQLLDRDYRVLTMVSRFGQLTTPQINTLVFDDVTTRIPCDRALKRLTEAGLLERVEQRHAGGRLGGSAVNVYQLGKHGWPMFFVGRRKEQRVIKPHSLAVADVYIAALNASRDGWLDILEWATEPDSWADVAGADLRPDLFIEIGIRDKGERITLWIEVDLGAERQRHIIEKIDRYQYAYDNAGDFPRDVFPKVLFLANSDDRARLLRRIVSRTPNLPDGLVAVDLISNFPESLR